MSELSGDSMTLPFGSNYAFGMSPYYMDDGPVPTVPCVFGKGFVSQFLVIANSFQNMDLDHSLAVKTEHKNVGFYDPAILTPVPHSTAPGS